MKGDHGEEEGDSRLESLTGSIKSWKQGLSASQHRSAGTASLTGSCPDQRRARPGTESPAGRLDKQRGKGGSGTNLGICVFFLIQFCAHSFTAPRKMLFTSTI